MHNHEALKDQSLAVSPSSGTDEAIGGEIRIGAGRAPGWVRWFFYAVYLVGILYLVLVPPPDGKGYGLQVAFAVILAAWLSYVMLSKGPPEP